MTIREPVNLTRALQTFDETYSPRIVATVNDYDVRIAKTKGEHVWHVHDDTDEFFLVLDGYFDIALRDEAGNERTVALRAGGHLCRAQRHRAQAELDGWIDPDARAERYLDHRRSSRGRHTQSRRLHRRPTALTAAPRCRSTST